MPPLPLRRRPPGVAPVARPGPFTPVSLAVAPVMLPGNGISPADSDFELPFTGNWTGTSNCTVGLSTAAAFSGLASMAITATASGSVTFALGTAPGIVPAAPLQGYVLSFYLLTPATGHTGTATLTFYNAGGGSLGSTATSALTIPAGTVGNPGTGWFPVTLNCASPAGAVADVIPSVTITGMAAGEVIFADLFYLARPVAQVLCAFPTEPANTTPQWCDLTPFVRRDTPIQITRGRQDNISDVQPGQLTLTCADDTGWLTPAVKESPFYPNVKIGRRIQVNLPDEKGTWHTRFDGQVTEYGPVPAPTGLAADVAIQAADVLAFLGRAQELSSWTKQEILLDSPQWHWTLNDPAGSSVAAESSGNNGPPLQLRHYYTGGSYAFAGGTAVTGNQNNGMESQAWVQGFAAGAANATGPGNPAAFPAVYFKQALGGTTRTLQGGWQLQAPLPSLVGTGTGQNWTLEAFLIPDIPNESNYGNANFTFIPCALVNTRTGQMLGFYVNGTNLVAAYWADFLTSTVATSAITFGGGFPSTIAAGAMQVAATITGNAAGATLTFYVNGVQKGSTVTLAAGASFNEITAGGPVGGGMGWLGQVSCLSVYPSLVSAARQAAHSSAALTGKYNTLAGSVVSSVVSYAGVPAFWNNVSGTAGTSYLDYYSLSGSSALSAMQSAEQADQGLIYADAAGRLNYAGRESRMGAGAPVLTLQAGQYEADLSEKVNDQYLVNSASIAAPGITTGVTAQNAQSLLDYQPYYSGTPAGPVSVPLQTYNGWDQEFLNATGITVSAFQPDNLTAAAQWTANIRAQPAPKAASIRVDMFTLPATAPDGVAPSVLFSLEINQVIALAGLPGSMPDTAHVQEFFIEGVSETIGLGIHDLLFYTSPASQSRAWVAGDAVYGKLDSTAVIGVSGPQTATAPSGESAGSRFPGSPYYPPVYATSMNGTGFVGALDQAGIWALLQQQVQPPMCVVAQAVTAQNLSNNTATQIVFDSFYYDNLSGMGWLAGNPNWYFVLVPGWYQLYGAVEFVISAAGKRTAWFEVCQNATLKGAGITGPTTNFLASGSVTPTPSALDCSVSISTKVYCQLGTAISLFCSQTSGGTLTPGTAIVRGGSMMAVRFLGDTATQD